MRQGQGGRVCGLLLLKEKREDMSAVMSRLWYKQPAAAWEEALRQAMDAGCELFTLEVRVSNTPAKTLYENHGFTEIHRSKHYYSDGEDALVMGLGI